MHPEEDSIEPVCAIWHGDFGTFYVTLIESVRKIDNNKNLSKIIDKFLAGAK